MNTTCSAEPCPVILSSSCVFYKGDVLLYTGINSGDNLQTSLQKIDAKFKDASVGYLFTNGITQSSPGAPVKLGGSLEEDTTIVNGGYSFSFSDNIYSPKFIVPSGTSNQFLKADGSLDSTPYNIGTLTNLTVTTGQGISATVVNATTTPVLNIINTLPDQTVNIQGGPGIIVTGTYPSFTIYWQGSSPTNVSNVTASPPLFSSGGTTPNISIQKSSTVNDGYLSAIDYTTFLNKPTTLSALTDVSITSPSNNQLLAYNGSRWININPSSYSLPIASSSILGGVKIGNGVFIGTDGTISVNTNYQAPLVSGNNIKTLASNSLLGSGDISLSTLLGVSNYYIPTTTDESNWNNKQSQLNGTGFVKASGTTITYDNNSYYLASNPFGYITSSALSPYLLSTTAASTYLSLSGGTMSGDIQQPNSPVNSSSLVNKNYIDNIIIGVIWVGTDTDSTSNISLSGEQTINGVTTSNSRVFVHGQTDQTQNGIYISSSGSWSRSSDASTSSQIIKLAILVQGGTNKGQQWINTNSTIVLGVTNITFGQNFGIIYGAGTGLLLSGTSFTIDSSYTATSSRTGYLSFTDWSTFNSKQSALAGSGIVQSSLGTISYITGTSSQFIKGDGSLDSNTYLTTGGASGSYQPLNTNLTSLSGLTYSSLGFVKMSASGVFSLDTNSYLTGITGLMVTTALGFTPYNSTNPSNYISLTALSSTATGLTYTNTTGVFSLTSGYLIPTTASYNNTNWDTAYTNRITSLTTTGSSGSATLVSNTLNIPTYTLAGLGGISLTALSATTPLSYNNTTGVFSIQIASTSQSGYLSSTDWNTFNNKQAALLGSGIVKSSSGTISYISGTSSQFVKADGSLDTNTYLTANQTITLSGDVTGTGNTSISTTLATITQSTGSSFVKISLDTKGRVIGNTAVGTSDLTSLLSSTYQPISNILTSLTTLSNASGVLTNNGSGGLSWASVSASQWTTSGNDIYYSIGRVSIGTSTASSTFQVYQPTTGPGTVSTSGTTVTGTGTQFTNTFKVGDTITISSVAYTISAIASDTSMTTNSLPTLSGQTYTLTGGSRFNVYGNGNVTIGTNNSATGYKLYVNGTTYFNGNVSIQPSSGGYGIIVNNASSAFDLQTNAAGWIHNGSYTFCSANSLNSSQTGLSVIQNGTGTTASFTNGSTYGTALYLNQTNSSATGGLLNINLYGSYSSVNNAINFTNGTQVANANGAGYGINFSSNIALNTGYTGNQVIGNIANIVAYGYATANPITALTFKAYSKNNGTNEVMRITGNKTVLINTTTDDGSTALQVNGSISTLSLNLTSTQTTINCSTSGTVIFSEPMVGSSMRMIMIYCNAALGTASYTFPTVFTNTPTVLSSNGLATSLVTSISTSAVTVTGVNSSGILVIIGY